MKPSLTPIAVWSHRGCEAEIPSAMYCLQGLSGSRLSVDVSVACLPKFHIDMDLEIIWTAKNVKGTKRWRLLWYGMWENMKVVSAKSDFRDEISLMLYILTCLFQNSLVLCMSLYIFEGSLLWIYAQSAGCGSFRKPVFVKLWPVHLSQTLQLEKQL